jgi:uncharacterized DUF497 family protein
MVRKIAGFDWDGGNIAKCQKYGLTLSEIETAFQADPLIAPDPASSASEQRFIAIAHSESRRPMFIAFIYRVIAGELRIRPASRALHA